MVDIKKEIKNLKRRILAAEKRGDYLAMEQLNQMLMMYEHNKEVK